MFDQTPSPSVTSTRLAQTSPGTYAALRWLASLLQLDVFERNVLPRQRRHRLWWLLARKRRGQQKVKC